MDKRQSLMEVAILWVVGGLFAFPFVYCLHGALCGEIDIGRISRNPSVEGYLHGPRAWLLTACAFAFSASWLLITIVGSLRFVSLLLNKNIKPTKTQGWLIVFSLSIIVLSALVAATDMYLIAVYIRDANKGRTMDCAIARECGLRVVSLRGPALPASFHDRNDDGKLLSTHSLVLVSEIGLKLN